MTAYVNEERSSLLIGFRNGRVAVDLQPITTNLHESTVVSSILIEMGGMEIEIRPSDRRTGVRSKSVTSRTNSRDSQLKTHGTLKPSHSYWDYSMLHGPTTWSQIFPHLQCKRFQSPIRIYTDQCEYKPVFARRPFILDMDENCLQILENTGHSFQVSGEGYSYITGGPVLDEYQFLQFHMHWGSHDNEGSEHVIDGIRLPAELHIVTWNTTQYKTAEEAVASEKFDAILVFAVLVEIIPMDNLAFAKLLDLFTKIIHKGEKINLDYGTISLRTLIPENINEYYTYDGSLTTPMCNEGVRWVIFRHRTGLSRYQMNQLRLLKHTSKGENSTNGYITRNFRPLMPVNGRTVHRSFL